MSDERLERLRLHRELEYLRAVGRISRKRRRYLGKTDFTKARDRVAERAAKLDALPKPHRRAAKPSKESTSSDASS